MSFDSLLDDLCDIYFIKERTVGGVYGTPSRKETYYEDSPDLPNIPCHFNKVGSPVPSQQDPKNEYTYDRKLNLPINTQISSMDKVVNKMDGIVYYAGIPDNIRNHHISVPLKKEDEFI